MPTLLSMAISPTSDTIYDDASTQFTVHGTFDDAVVRPLGATEIRFTSSNTAVATVTNTLTLWGLTYGVAPGTCTITAHINPGSLTPGSPAPVSATLTVNAHPAYTPANTRFALAFDTDTLDPYPAWTAIDAHPNLVTSYTITRGRSYELDQTNAGTAQVTIMDPDGILDPSNPSGPHYGQIRPLLHGVISRHNPVTDTWEERFRGYVTDYTYDLDPSQRVSKLTIALADLFELLLSATMSAGTYGFDYDTWTGQIIYDSQRNDDRMRQVLADFGIPRRMAAILPGLVTVQKTTYSEGETALTAIQEAANAEFPNVANVYCDRHGRVCFHGRRTRFDPVAAAADAGSAWDFHQWKAGDGAAITASPTDTAQVRALGYQRGASKIINVAIAGPAGATDQNMLYQRSTDPDSIVTYGQRSWQANNLITLNGGLDLTPVTPALMETFRFAEFYVANYAQPRDRISQIAFRSLHPDDPRAAANWDLLSRVDVGDTIQITVATPGGGGFVSEGYFVEGVHDDVKPLTGDYDDVTVTLDLSPRAYYTVDPWTFPRDVIVTNPENITRDNPGMLPNPGPINMGGHGSWPTFHAHEHAFNGPDPLPIHYENVGTGAGGGANLAAYSVSGDLTVSTGGLRFYTVTGGTLSKIVASVGTAPAGSGVTVQVNVNGTSVDTITIPAGGHHTVDPVSVAYGPGDYFTVDITAIGSSTAGADLVVELQL